MGLCQLQITLCVNCCHIWNAGYQDDPEALYDQDYYSSKAASPRAREYQEALTGELDRLVGVRGKTVLEIGCGDGLLLKSLGARGANGIGFEPSSTFHISKEQAGIRVFNEPFPFDGILDWGTLDLATLKLQPQVHLVVMRHVLEHLDSPREVLRSLRTQSLGQPGPRFLFLEVPNVYHLLQERLYFDFYNDHIHYFSIQSITRLLQSAGWAPMVRTNTAAEFLGLVSANGGCGVREAAPAGDSAVPAEGEPIARVAMEFRRDFARWKSRMLELITGCREQGQRLAVWGAGSRGVALLAGLDLPDGSYSYVVDSDPNVHGKYLPMNDRPVHSPEWLRQEPVDCVLVTSYTYFDEICAQLDWFRSKGGRIIKAYPNPELV